MTPEVKKIGNKLFDKVELASKKIELGIVEDIAKISNDANQLVKTLANDKIALLNADKEITQAKKNVALVEKNADKIVADSDKNLSKGSSLLPKIGTILDKADAAAKGLGLDAKAIPGYAELDKLYFALETAQKEVSNFTFKD
jgi:hypothetical protein